MFHVKLNIANLDLDWHVIKEALLMRSTRARPGMWGTRLVFTT